MRSILLVLTIFLYSSCGAILKKGAKEIGEEISEEATERVAKNAVGEVTEATMKNLPRGAKALEVVQRSDGGFAPVLNNLGSQSRHFDEAVNLVLLKERRKAISPFHQMATTQQLASSKVKLIEGVPANGEVLRKNMYAVMDPKAVKVSKGFGGNAAHHIVEGTDPMAKKSREILERFGVDINSPHNGILLPTDNTNSIYKGAVHKTSHTEAYSNYVYAKIKDVSSRDELLSKMTELKYELYNGKLNLEGPAQLVNKNL